MNDTAIMKKGQMLPTYMAYPCFLLEMELSETTKLVYVLLLNRCRLSDRTGKFTDPNGDLYIYYTIEEIAKDCHKCPMTVKNALKELENAGLLKRKRQGPGKASILYVKLPHSADDDKNPYRQISVPQTSKKDTPTEIEIYPQEGQDIFCDPDIFLSRIYYK